MTVSRSNKMISPRNYHISNRYKSFPLMYHPASPEGQDEKQHKSAGPQNEGAPTQASPVRDREEKREALKPAREIPPRPQIRCSSSSPSSLLISPVRPLASLTTAAASGLSPPWRPPLPTASQLPGTLLTSPLLLRSSSS